jgi:UDP:flavonoid glycosyltransferase YjiC (YdhE family)
MIALGAGLRAAGHCVSVAAGRDFTSQITAAGLNPEPFDIDIDQASQSELGRRWLAGSMSLREEGRLMSQAMRVYAPVVAETLDRIAKDYDGVVSGLLTFDGMLSLAAAGSTRHITAALAPVRPTRVGGAAMFQLRPEAVSVLNLVSGYLVALGGHRLLLPAGDLTRQRLGLPSQGFLRHLQRARRTDTLLAVSPHVVPSSGDPRTAITGYWVTPDAIGYTPPVELAKFLDAGEPPVYLGFGSMPSADPPALFAMIVRALARAGRRGVLRGSWGGWRPEDPPNGLFLLDDAPHDWLFPRMAAVVHHGGAGTTGAAVRAGVPQIAVPHMGDQPYWGRRIAALGLGPAPIRRRLLTESNLAASLTALTTDGASAERAARMAEIVRAEDGVGHAVDVLTTRWGLT